MKRNFVNDYVKVPALALVTAGLAYSAICGFYGQNPVDVTRKVADSLVNYTKGVQTNILPKDKSKALETITSDEYKYKLYQESIKPVEP